MRRSQLYLRNGFFVLVQVAVYLSIEYPFEFQEFYHRTSDWNADAACVTVNAVLNLNAT